MAALRPGLGAARVDEGDEVLDGFVDAVACGGRPLDGIVQVRDFRSGVESRDGLVEEVAVLGEGTAGGEQFLKDVAVVGDRGGDAGQVAGGGEAGLGQEPGQGQVRGLRAGLGEGSFAAAEPDTDSRSLLRLS
ncbi:hypothetical protein [Streptomyces sp. NPDC058683]|uniref:hypothetical protein n=1 Tax=Streptomyces sp. NPDC058683 TaxID=3346597 RepID=UPI003663ECA6